MSVTAIVPLKALDQVKQRLDGRLTAAQRRSLMCRLFTHVVTTCTAAPSIDDVLAVVGDDAALRLAEQASVRAVRETGGGLNAAVRHATAQVPAGHATLVVVADLPEVTVDDLEAVIAAARDDAPAVIVAPTADGGTGALLRTPGDVIAPSFGVASAAAHLRAAQAAGVRAALLRRPGLARDVDRPADLDRYAGPVAAGGTS